MGKFPVYCDEGRAQAFRERGVTCVIGHMCAPSSRSAGEVVHARTARASRANLQDDEGLVGNVTNMNRRPASILIQHEW